MSFSASHYWPRPRPCHILASSTYPCWEVFFSLAYCAVDVRIRLWVQRSVGLLGWWCCLCAGVVALSVSLEAEATSAVIAAQALQAPMHGGSQVSPAPSSSTAATDDAQLHCGCQRWSPSTSRSTVVDIESTAGLSASLYQPHSPAMPNVQTGARAVHRSHRL